MFWFEPSTCLDLYKPKCRQKLFCPLSHKQSELKAAGVTDFYCTLSCREPDVIIQMELMLPPCSLNFTFFPQILEVNNCVMEIAKQVILCIERSKWDNGHYLLICPFLSLL